MAAAALARVDPEDLPAVVYIKSDRLSEQKGRDVFYKFSDVVRERAEAMSQKEKVLIHYNVGGWMGGLVWRME